MEKNKTILNLNQLINDIDELKNQKYKIVLTNGCFDILHTGHVKYLQACKKLGDILIVTINSDMSIKRLKGDGRPINSQTNRLIMLEALGCVDMVYVHEEDTIKDLISVIKPDVYVKGGDYNINTMNQEEVRVLNSLKIPIIIEGYIKEMSTTNIISKIIKSYK